MTESKEIDFNFINYNSLGDSGGPLLRLKTSGELTYYLEGITSAGLIFQILNDYFNLISDLNILNRISLWNGWSSLALC